MRNCNNDVIKVIVDSPENSEQDVGPFLGWLRSFLRVAVMVEPPTTLGRIRIAYNALTLAISCVAGWVLLYLRYDDLSANTDVLLHASLSGHTLFVYLWYAARGARLRRVCRAVAARFRSAPFAPALALSLPARRRPFDAADAAALLVMRLGAYNCLVVFGSFTLYATVLAPKRQLIFPIWTPFSLDDNASYLLLAIHQMSVFALYTGIQVSGCGVSIGGAFHIGASFDVLADAFRDSCRLPQPEDRRRNIASCVKMHNAILEVVEEYKAVFDVIITEVLIFCEVVLCFIGFQIILALEAKNYTRAVIHVPMACMITFHLFMFCYPGQHITNKNEQFRVSLYTSAWQNLDLPLQRCVLMCLRQSLRPVRVSYRGVAQASMHSFLNALKGAFSYVNILLVLRDVR